MASNSVRIGCASAFYGDSQLAARQLVEKGDIDYLVFDYLAESTMAILARMQMKDAGLGFAVDFVSVAMKDVLADCASKGIKVVANAGGVNVPGCIAAVEMLAESMGLNLKIAGVYGDDLREYKDLSLTDMETGEPLPSRLASSNAYLGAGPIAEALAAGADVVVTGRVVDSAVVLGPLIHEFGWAMDDYDRLAQGSLAGHVIECGAQCTGGNFTDWHLVPDFSDMSYPVADVSADGSFHIDIPPGTGGLVNRATVGEQIVYEIGDPANYLLPDVACDFSHVTVTETGLNRVLVTGARGRAPGPDYKACSTWADGWRLVGSHYIGGLNAAAKARTNLEAWLKRCNRMLAARGMPPFRRAEVGVIGAEDPYGPHAKDTGVREAMATYGLHHDDKRALGLAAAELASLATSGAPGITAFGAGRPRPQPLMQIASSLVARSAVPVTVQFGSTVISKRTQDDMEGSSPFPAAKMILPAVPDGPDVTVPLEKLVWARSGDKGDHANIGIIARDARYLPALDHQLTAAVVADYFAHQVDGDVTRYAMPGLGGWNFLLTHALGGGATASLRVDSQAKTWAQMLLSMQIKVPASLEQGASV